MATKTIKELRKELGEAQHAAKVLAQAFESGGRPPAGIMTQALAYETKHDELPGGWLFGDVVLVHRGSSTRTEGPGRGRWVRMRLLGATQNGCFCQLLEDDPDDTMGLSHAGDKGFWSGSAVTRDIVATNNIAR